jgi:hypothetical protein
MIARILVTAILLLLAIGGFFGAAPTAASVLNPFGLLFLILAGVAWFAWDTVREGFAANSGRPGVPIIRLGAGIIGGMFSSKQGTERRSSGEA